MGDQLGLNFWTSKSKYGATIQTALDYTMGLNPGSEDVSDIFPHVAAVAAAYGDPTGKYANFLKSMDPSYMSMPFYYYDQTSALSHSPAAQVKGKRDGSGLLTNPKSMELGDLKDGLVGGSGAIPAPTPTVASDVPTPTIPFQCPAAFATAAEVELDDGIYVTCDELKPFYGYIDDAKKTVQSAT